MKKHTRTEYSLLNIFTGLFGYALNTILGFLCRIIFVKYLSADYLGINGLFTNLLSMLSLAELGVGSAIVYALYKPLAENDTEKINSLVKFYGKAYKIIGIVIGVIGLLLVPYLNLIITEQPQISEDIRLLYIINLFNTASTYFFSYRSSLIIANQQNYIVQGLNYIVTIIQSILQMVILCITKNYLAYLIVQTIGIFCYNVIVSFIATKQFPFIKNKAKPLTKVEKKSLFSNIRDLMIYKISGLLVNNTDNILITFFNGLEITGIASNYTLLINTINSLLCQIFNGLTASIGNHNVSNSDENKYEMFKFINFLNFWFFSWGGIGFLLCSDNVIKLLFGAQYILDKKISLILSINFIMVGMLNSVWTYKHTLGLFKKGRFVQFFTGIINIILSIILGKYLGLFGILFATCLSRLFTSFWYDPCVVFKYGLKKSPVSYFKNYSIYMFVLILTTFVCYFLVGKIEANTISTVLLQIVLCSMLINVVFALCFFKKKEFKKLIDLVKNIKTLINKNGKKID